jgi:hypothetical protein
MAVGFLTGRAAKSRVRSDTRRKQEEDDQYEMANLFPRTTGLPLTVWVSPRGRARHAARIKVSLTPSPADFALVSRWISLNEEALIEFWNEAIDSVELGGRLRKI